MHSVNAIQAALVARLKSKVAITSLLANANEVREDQWQGTTFLFPNVRIDLDRLTPVAECNSVRVSGSILCFSDMSSSEQANNIANAIFSEFNNKSWTSSGVRFVFLNVEVVPAIRQDERTWRSEVPFLVHAE